MAQIEVMQICSQLLKNKVQYGFIYRQVGINYDITNTSLSIFKIHIAYCFLVQRYILNLKSLNTLVKIPFIFIFINRL